MFVNNFCFVFATLESRLKQFLDIVLNLLSLRCTFAKPGSSEAIPDSVKKSFFNFC